MMADDAGAVRSPQSRHALLEWCDRTWPQLYRFVYARVQNREEAEDLTQETYLRVLRQRDPSHDPPSLPYLHTVALNLIRDRWRRIRARGARVPLEESLLLTDDGGDATVDRLWLETLIDELPDDYRQVIRLRIIAGLSRAETARRMDRSEAAIRGLQYRALQALRDRIRGDGRA